MRDKISCLFILIVVSLAVQGHEFWLQPLKFNHEVDEEASIYFIVGENFTGELWDLKKPNLAQVLCACRARGSLVPKMDTPRLRLRSA